MKDNHNQLETIDTFDNAFLTMPKKKWQSPELNEIQYSETKAGGGFDFVDGGSEWDNYS